MIEEKRDEIDTDELVERLSYYHYEDDSLLELLGFQFECAITCSVEKVHQLHHNYFFDIDFGDLGVFSVEIESSIDNGTQVNSEGWDFSTANLTRTVNVLKDIVFNEESFDLYCLKKQIEGRKKQGYRRKVVTVFNREKPNLLKLHRQESYDNYVTGGGTSKTKEYYRSKLSEVRVFAEYVYEEKEVDRNLI